MSGTSRYRLVLLSFHSDPQVIRPVFNLGRFGPPRGLTPASACPWIARSVSGLPLVTKSPYSDSLSLRLRSSLNLATNESLACSRCKKHAVTPEGAPTTCKSTVSGTISLPFWGAFHLSLTVLVHYRSPGST